jgi:alkanesulfonate monooxygenase SsuD/methylene tetrahydromethanopterin reductase-like flavin-dependent oxidoreductase (luciferase family)
VADRLRHAVHVPNLRQYGDPAVLVGLAVDAEAAGWDGFFVWDHILHRRAEPEPVVDPWIVLAACAVRTQRIKLGTLLTPVARRRPWKLAREVATLDQLSGGRAVLGAGLGAPRHDEFEAFGEEADDRRRAARLDEGLEVLAGLLSGEPFSHRGEFHSLDEMRFLPAR